MNVRELYASPTVDILGVPFVALGMEDCCKACESLMEEGGFAQVVTANPEAVMLAVKSDELMAIFRNAAFVTPDGIGAVWASQIYGKPVKERVPGFDMVLRLLHALESKKRKVFVIGTNPATHQKGLHWVRQQYPGLIIEGYHGYFSESEEEDVVRRVELFCPDLVLVGLGMPRQEYFIAKHGLRFNALCVGIGGSIDVWAGVVKRAPKMWQWLRLEWFYRLLSQPSRWRRQLALPKFAWRVWIDSRMNKQTKA